MKPTSKLVWAGLLLLSATPSWAQTLEQQLHAEVARFVETVNRGDPRALADLYVDRPGVGSIGDGEISRGWGTVAELLELMHAQADSFAALPTPALTDSGPPAPVRQTMSCVVSRIVDGDTFECSRVGRVRLIGMDTPEFSQAPFGGMAAQALAALIAVGSSVELERDIELRDQYGRLLAYVWTDRLLVNWMLVRQGWAVLLTYPPNVQYVEWFTEAQQQAREEGVGLWAIDAFDCLPVDRRRGRCD